MIPVFMGAGWYHDVASGSPGEDHSGHPLAVGFPPRLPPRVRDPLAGVAATWNYRPFFTMYDSNSTVRQL